MGVWVRIWMEERPPCISEISPISLCFAEISEGNKGPAGYLLAGPVNGEDL